MEYSTEPMVFVDLETTGATPTEDRITEIGIIQVDTDGCREWSRLVNPGVRIPPFIESLTGITNAMVAGAPRFADVAAEVLDLLNGRVFVAHNARFDYGFLKNEFGRVGRPFQAKVLCTVKLSRRLFPQFRRHSLDALVERHGLAPDGDRHRALTDARLIHRFWEQVRGSFEPDVIAQAVGSSVTRETLPEHLDPALADELPEVPGVYLFFAENDVPLYVGRAANIRQRVLAHFARDLASERDMDLFRQVRRVDWSETGGETGALLREAVLVKQLCPTRNRSLRAVTELCSWQLAERGEMHLVPQLVTAAEMDFGRGAGLYGLFKTPKEARLVLAGLARGHELCLGLLGLEKLPAGKPCCAFEMRQCRGACVGREAPARHSLRLVAALAGLQLRAWPFRGPAMIREGKWVHLTEDWRYLGSARDEEGIRAALASAKPPFDRDVYRILEKRRARLERLPSQFLPPPT
ncbi:MAG TPA: exonuclease domain-containing protein [Rhodocyclaceae bacterium]|nr:exonuclease domain-containing protein [Rhodocyclaceae bacterium]HNH35705.1 exonuclease domain-containing protein [Rhodocyclaceae bacterium]